MKKNLVLIGFMGTGKSSVGKALSAKLRCPLVDIDSEIEKKENQKIAVIFETQGEPFFRGLEKEAVRAAALASGTVITTGGGAVLDADNFTALKQNGIVVALTATPETIHARVKGSARRPLLAGPNKFSEIQRLLAERKPFYDKADYFFETDGRNASEVAAMILERLKGVL